MCMVLVSLSAHARQGRKKDPFTKFQAGFWFGPITPVYTTADDVNKSLGGGIFLRSLTFLDSFKLGIDASYEKFESRGVNKLILWPVYGSLLWRIPLKTPLVIQLKAGGGGCYVTIYPDRASQWDPMFMLGGEVSFPAGKWVNIGLRIEYLCIYENHIPGSVRNGHIVNAGISLYFNFGS